MNVDYNTETQEITVELNTPAIEFDTPTGGRGLKGETGLPGRDGIDGVDGRDGLDGQDGISPTVSTSKSGKTTTVTITDADGEKTVTILDGEDGQDGQDGQDGEDGVSPIITTSKSGKTTTITIVDADGTKTATILDGDDADCTWGNITGTLSDQTDLKNALDAKADVSSLATVATTGDYDDLIDKPTIPTKVSDLSNDLNFIDNTVNNLTNYYTSSNTYTKTEVDNLIGTVSSLNIEVVQTLPTQDISTSTIYLVPNSSQGTNNYYDEYIYVSNSWELIGSTQVDLSNYYTKTETDTLLSTKANVSSIPSKTSDLTNDSNFVSDASYVHTDNNYTTTEKNKLSGIASGAEVNVQSDWNQSNSSSDDFIKNKPTIPTVNNATLTIQKNGSTVKTFTANASTDVTANITVPTKVSDLTNDSGFLTSTDIENKEDVILIKNSEYSIPDEGDYDNWFARQPLPTSEKVKLSNLYTEFAGMTGHSSVFSGEVINKDVYLYNESNLNPKRTFVAKLTSAQLNYNDPITSTNFDVMFEFAGIGDIRGEVKYRVYGQDAALGSDGSWTESCVNHNFLTTDVSTSLTNQFNAKQDTLVSGTNIKTINNESLLGSGNINISSGGGTMVDMRVNGSSVVDANNVGNIVTETAYDSSTNKIATMSDVPDTSSYIDKDVNNLTNYSLTTTLQTNKSITKGVEYIVGTQASDTNAWTGTSTDTGCSSGSLYTGKMIMYHLPTAGNSSAATLNLTLPDGTTTGAKNIYRLASTTVTTNFAAGCDIFMVYDGTQWKINAYVDTSGSNTIGYQLRTNSAIWTNKTGYTVKRYVLLFEVDGGLSGAATTIKTETSKTTVNFKYKPGGVIKYYSTNESIANNSNFATTGLWDQYAVNLGYTFNTGSTLESGKPVYMRCTVNSDGTLSPNYSGTPSHPIVQALPSTADGKVYVYLGQAYSTTNMELCMKHPIYEYKNGKIREYVPAIAYSEISGTPSLANVATSGAYSDLSGTPTLATVATSGSYNDLTNKPTIPDELSDLSDDSTHRLVTDTEKSTWNSKSDFSGSYNDLTNKPTIPTVNDATLTIQKNGTTIDTFTANASSNKTVNVTVPTKVSDLTNDSGFITSYTETDPIFTASAAAGITSSNISDWNAKMDSSHFTGDIRIMDLDDGVYISDNSNKKLYYYGTSDTTKYIRITTGAIVIVSGDSSRKSFIVTEGISAYYGYSSTSGGDYEEIIVKDDIVNNLTTSTTGSVLDASQGKALKDTLDATTSTSISNMNNIGTLANLTTTAKTDLVSAINEVDGNIPTVNNGKLTIGRNGTKIDEFTANSASDVNINISVPVDDVQVNGTSILSSGIANLITNTAYNSSTNKIATMSDIPSPNIMTVYLKADYTMPNSNTVYDLTNTAVSSSIGSKLTFSNGKIVIGAGVSKVKVSYTAKTISSANATRTFTYLMQDISGTATALSQEGHWYGGTNWQVVNTYGPITLNVNEGDAFYLSCYGYKNNVIAGATSSFMPTILTVEVIE